jgi:transcriptional regulator with GAF, ATPase, and Fis domain
MIGRVSNSDATVLISGESGTEGTGGQRDPPIRRRRNGPLIKVNCAAIPDTAGSGTLVTKRGIHQCPFEEDRDSSRRMAAHYSWMIAEIPLALQAKLLRAIQEND